MDEEKIERIMNEIILTVAQSPLDGMNGIMSAVSHIIFAGYKEKDHRREAIKAISEALLSNVEILEQKGNLKENYLFAYNVIGRCL